MFAAVTEPATGSVRHLALYVAGTCLAAAGSDLIVGHDGGCSISRSPSGTHGGGQVAAHALRYVSTRARNSCRFGMLPGVVRAQKADSPRFVTVTAAPVNPPLS